VLALKNSDIECSICYNRFATDLYSKDNSALKLLPVVGTCDHIYCHGCVLLQQQQYAKTKAGGLPKQISCMSCSKKDAFRPDKPEYDRRLIDWIDRSMPVCTQINSGSV
jgi:RING-type zinc-finger